MRTPPDTRPLALWDAWPAHPLTLVVNLAVPPRQDELTRLRQKRVLALWQQRTALGDTAVETTAIKDELDTMLRRAFTAGDRLVWARVHIVAWGPAAQVHRADDAIIQAGRRVGLELLPEPVLGSTLFLQSLPLGFDPAYPEERFLRRARRLPSPNLAQLLPLYGAFRGTATPAILYLNRRGETVHFDPFDSPTAPHGVVVGTSGSGKSFLINHLVQQVLPLGAAVVILDRWASYEQLCTVHRGRYVALDYNHPIGVNPFLGPLDRGHRAFLGALLAEMASGGDEILSREERGVLADTLAAFAQQHPPGQEARLRDFVASLRTLPDADDARSLGLRLARKLGPYYGDGPYAGFFDGPNAFTLDRALTVVELSGLRGTPDVQAALMFVLLHQLTLFFAAPSRLLQCKYLISDETWALLQHAASARVLEEIARTFRKLQTAALFLSQQGSDFLSPAGKAIRDNSGFAYFLQQNPEEVETMRTLFDLTEPEVALLKTVRRRPGWSEAYLRLPEQQGGVIRLVPDPYLRWLATQQPQERSQRQAALEAAGGDLHQAVAMLATQELAAGKKGATV
jgi:conjugal transfer ATP-binding protein TraC